MLDFLDISKYLGLPTSATAHAPGIDYMMSLVHWLMLVLCVGWGVYFIYVLFRFRQSKNPTRRALSIKMTAPSCIFEYLPLAPS